MAFLTKNINYKEFLTYSKFLHPTANIFQCQLRKLLYNFQDGEHLPIKL